MKVTILRWHDAKLIEPEQDGEYLIWPEGDEIRSVPFTVEGGWNTYYDENGEIGHKREGFEREDWNRYTRLWAYQPREVIELE